MRNDFGRLKRKIFLWVILSALLAVLIGMVLMSVLVDGFLQDPFARLFVGGLRRIFRLSYSSAQNIYFRLFQDNKQTWVFLGFCVLMFLCFYIVIAGFTRYFRQVMDGVDKLAEETEGEIILSPELDFMEKKLNAVKHTLEKRARDAQEAEQRKNDLVVYLAHDIKTPLTSIIGYLSLLEEAPDMPPEQKARYVNITLDKAYRLEQLINEFFEITRFNLQSIVLTKEQVNLSLMLRQMTDEFYPVLAQQGKEAVLQVEEDLVVPGDGDKLARVFNNIFKNAIAYSYENTKIEINARREEWKVILSFANKGPEIPPEKLQSIFEKFFRLDSARSSNTGGAGLGLAIAKEILKAHGGSITAQSQGEQTVFTVVLPIEG